MTLQPHQQRQILESAREQFLLHGFSKVTTGEIAAELGISKKTLYQYFRSKEEIVEQVVDFTLREIKSGIEDILADEKLPFIEKLERSLFFLSNQIPRLVRKPLLQDIQKKMPQLWKRVADFREKMILSKFSDLIREGVQQGIFRPDLRQPVVVLIYLNTIQALINPETLSAVPYTAQEVFDEIIQTLFYGLLTDSSRKKLRRKTDDRSVSESS